jgi:hypothetical protein
MSSTLRARNRTFATTLAALVAGSLPLSQVARAESDLQAEDSFREVFVTAGYSAAFGAAIGAALLPFLPNPSLSSLRYVAGGASLGFIAGSGFAFYNLAGGQTNAYPAEEVPLDDEPFQGEDDGMAQAPRDERRLPVGALVVGHGARAAIAVPAFAIVDGGALVNVLDWRF